MTHYSEALKVSIIARMLLPQNARVPALAKKTGIPKDTLYCWQLKARGRGGAGPDPARQAGAFSREEKFAIVLGTACFNELELGEYCRRKSLYPEQIAHWKKAFIQGSSAVVSKTEREQLQQQAKTIKQLQSELHRKDRALAEAAAQGRVPANKLADAQRAEILTTANARRQAVVALSKRLTPAGDNVVSLEERKKGEAG